MLLAYRFKNRLECINVVCQNISDYSISENKIAVLEEIIAVRDTINTSSSKSYCKKTERENRMLYDKIKNF